VPGADDLIGSERPVSPGVVRFGDGLDVTRVVWVSGGKDSTAMSLRLAELHPDVPWRFICTPTLWLLAYLGHGWVMVVRAIREKPALSAGGSGEIRTHEGLPLAGFQDARRFGSHSDGRGRDAPDLAGIARRMGQGWVRGALAALEAK